MIERAELPGQTTSTFRGSATLSGALLAGNGLREAAESEAGSLVTAQQSFNMKGRHLMRRSNDGSVDDRSALAAGGDQLGLLEDRQMR